MSATVLAAQSMLMNSLESSISDCLLFPNWEKICSCAVSDSIWYWRWIGPFEPQAYLWGEHLRLATLDTLLLWCYTHAVGVV